MIRALIWKEWREQRGIVLAGLGIATVMPLVIFAGATATGMSVPGRSLTDLMPVFCAALLWPLFAAAAGAGTFANESGDNTMGFLMSRPVSRVRVWSAKVGLAALAALLVMAGSWAVVVAVRSLAPVNTSATEALSAFRGAFLNGLETIIHPATLVLVFASAVFFSGYLSRPMTAAAGGLAATIGVIVPVQFLWPLIGLAPGAEQAVVPAMLGGAALLLLLDSLRRFMKSGALKSDEPKKAIGIVAGAVAVVAGVSLSPAILADNFGSLDSAIIEEIEYRGGISHFVVESSLPYSALGTVWRLSGEAQSAVRLTGRLTFSPVMSPDGEWVVYYSARGPGGVLSKSVELRAVRIDGSGDRLVHEFGRPGRRAGLRNYNFRFGPPLFSPDGTRLLIVPDRLLYLRQVLVIDVASSAIRTLRLPLDAVGSGSLTRPTPGYFRGLGWSADGRGLVMETRRRSDEPYVTVSDGVVLFDFEEQAIVPIFEPAGDDARIWTYWGSWFRRGVSGARGLARLPVRVAGTEYFDGGAGLVIVGVAGGDVVPVREMPCGFASAQISGDGRFFAYLVRQRCDDELDDDTDREPALHLLDLITGEDRLVARFSATGASVSLSHDGSRSAVVLRRPGGRRELVIVESDGTIRRATFDPLYQLEGWLDDDRLLFRHRRSRSSFRGYAAPGWPLTVVDANTDEVIARYPR